MTFNGWTFVFEVLNFLVLAYILQRLLYKPLHDAVDRRRQEIEHATAEALQSRHDAEKQREDLDARLAALAVERQTVLRAARQEADAERERMLAEATHEMERRTVEAREALTREREEMLQTLQQDVVTEAGRLAERLLREVSDEDLDEQLVGRLSDTVRSLPLTERGVLARSWSAAQPVTLEAAHALSPEATKRVRDAVSDVLGRGIEIEVQRVPELVSGVRLRLDGHVWDASLAGILERTDNEHARL